MSYSTSNPGSPGGRSENQYCAARSNCDVRLDRNHRNAVTQQIVKITRHLHAFGLHTLFGAIRIFLPD